MANNQNKMRDDDGQFTKAGAQHFGQRGGQARKRQMQQSGESYEELGRRGGTATAEEYGSEFYSKIGREGGKRSRRGRKSNNQ